jgi:small subunit ribosomal protein S24e
VFGIKTQFGGGRSSGFALIYNSTEEKAKYDSETLLRRDGLKKKPAVGRKPKKEIKSRQKKVKGTAKAKVQAGKQKK